MRMSSMSTGFSQKHDELDFKVICEAEPSNHDKPKNVCLCVNDAQREACITIFVVLTTEFKYHICTLDTLLYELPRN